MRLVTVLIADNFVLTLRKDIAVLSEGIYCDIIYAFAIAKSTRYLQHTDIHFQFLAIIRDNSIVGIDHYDQHFSHTCFVLLC